MKDRLIEILTLAGPFLLEWVKALATGWSMVFRRIVLWAMDRILGADRFALLTLGAGIVVTIAAILPWISYNVTLMKEETVYLGANLKTIFALPGLAAIFLVLFDLPYRLQALFAVVVPVFLVYGFGFYFQDPILTRMTERDSYQLLPTVYLYGITLLALAGLGLRGTKSPLIPLFSYLQKEK